MSWFFLNKKVGVLSIILDIQSGLVRGALVYEHTQIISVVTRDISGKSRVINAEHLTKRILKLISEVVEHLVRDANGNKISNINYILSSPWIFSQLKTIKIDYEKETEIQHTTIEKIIQDELKKNTKTADTQPIEQKVFEIRLNGYPAIAFEGKRAHSLEVSLSTSFASSALLAKVNDVVSKHLHIKNHSVYSALLLQYTALRESLKNKNEFIYIHVHSELTDMIIVKDGLCKHMASFPYGIKTLLRKLASETKESIESCDSLLSLYQGNKLNDAERENMQKILPPLVHEWSDLCTKSFEGVFDITNLPTSVYLSAHSHFDLFKEALTFQNKFNFDITQYDSIDIGNQITFGPVTAQSNMIKLYTFALHL